MTKAEFERRLATWRRRSPLALLILVGAVVAGMAWLYAPVALGVKWPLWVELTWDLVGFCLALLSISLYGRALKAAVRHAGLVCNACGGLLLRGTDEGRPVLESGRCPACGDVVISESNGSHMAPAT